MQHNDELDSVNGARMLGHKSPQSGYGIVQNVCIGIKILGTRCVHVCSINAPFGRLRPNDISNRTAQSTEHALTYV